MITHADVKKWWLRRVGQYVLSGITCLLLVLSLARILDVNVVHWPKAAVWIVRNYGEFLVWLGRTIISLLQSIPVVVFDLLTAYLLIGALTRLAIIDIGLNSEKSFLDNGPMHWRDEDTVKGIEEARRATRSESARFYLLWPVRVYSDLHGRYFSLTPMRISFYLATVVALLLLGMWFYPSG